MSHPGVKSTMRSQSASIGSADISLLTYYHSLNTKTRLATWAGFLLGCRISEI